MENEAQDIDDNSEYDDDLMPASQSQHEMYQTTKEKYGSLSKEDFKEQLTLRHNENDLPIFRTGLFAVAREVIPDTPEGILITRQDTSNSGGFSVSIKFSDDIFQMFKYIEGDNSIDVMKMFTKKC